MEEATQEQQGTIKIVFFFCTCTLLVTCDCIYKCWVWSMCGNLFIFPIWKKKVCWGRFEMFLKSMSHYWICSMFLSVLQFLWGLSFLLIAQMWIWGTAQNLHFPIQSVSSQWPERKGKKMEWEKKNNKMAQANNGRNPNSSRIFQYLMRIDDTQTEASLTFRFFG